MAQGWRKAMAYLGLVDDPDEDWDGAYDDPYDDPYADRYDDRYDDRADDRYQPGYAEDAPEYGYRGTDDELAEERSAPRTRERPHDPERSRRAGGRGGARSAMARGPATESSAVTVVRPARGRDDRPPERVAERPEEAVLRPARPVGPAARVHVMVPGGFEDAQEVGDRFKASQPVIINLQGVDRDLQRRLIDFSSGLAYALGGRLSKAADQVFLLTPSDVIVSDEEKERLQAEGLYRRG